MAAIGYAKAKDSICYGLAVLCMLIVGVESARLVVVPLSSDSHISAFTALTTQLESLSGHEIHMVISSSLVDAATAMATSRNPNHHHHYITYPFRPDFFSAEMANLATANPIAAMRIGYEILSAMIEMVIGNEELLAQISDLKADLVIGDATASYGYWLNALLGVSSIEFDVGTSNGVLHSSQWGGQLHPAYIPATGTSYPSTGMTLWQRCINVAATAAVKVIMHVHRHCGPIARLAKQHGVSHVPGTGPYRPLLLLVNFDWALEPVRPVPPNIKYVGALMPRPPRELPEDLKAWLDGPGGEEQQPLLPAVLFSFGSSFLAPEAALPAIAAAINTTRTHMRFLLRLRDPEHQLWLQAVAWHGIQLQPGDVLIRASFPQNDLLAHPNVAAFVTQGGYLSMQEAGYHGVPVVGIPLTMGQGELVQHAEDQGRGLVVPKEGLIAGDARRLTEALMKVVASDSFKAQAAATAARLRAHSRSPGEQAADWVDYALALRNSISFLHTKGQDLPWWQILLLDVLLVYSGTAALGVLLLLLAARLACGVARRRTERTEEEAPPGMVKQGRGEKRKHA